MEIKRIEKKYKHDDWNEDWEDLDRRDKSKSRRGEYISKKVR